MQFDNETVKQLFEDMESRSDKAVEFMKTEFALLRAGRANSKLLEKVTVDYYGVQTPLPQMANISTPESRVLVINAWDKGALKDIEKAILAANLGVTPNNDGSVIRLIFPELNEERRKDLVKQVKKQSEDCKVVIRNIRRDVIEALKKLKNDKAISEDDQKRYDKEADDKTAKWIDAVDKAAKDKSAEIMSV